LSVPLALACYLVVETTPKLRPAALLLGMTNDDHLDLLDDRMTAVEITTTIRLDNDMTEMPIATTVTKDNLDKKTICTLPVDVTT
jgi:hypothetical protein